MSDGRWLRNFRPGVETGRQLKTSATTRAVPAPPSALTACHRPSGACHSRLPKRTRSRPVAEACATSQWAYRQPALALLTLTVRPASLVAVADLGRPLP